MIQNVIVSIDDMGDGVDRCCLCCSSLENTQV